MENEVMSDLRHDQIRGNETQRQQLPPDPNDDNRIEEEDETMMMADSTPTNINHSSASGSDEPHSTAVAYLSIRKQPPTHVFSDEIMEVEFSIEAVRGSSDSPPTNVSIQASLITEDHDAERGASEPALSLTVLEEPRISASRRTGKLRCRVHCVHPSTSTKAFAIRLSTKENIVTEVTTRDIHIVTAKLRVIADHWSPIWYKDEGGRDKCMEVHVQVYNADDEPLTNIHGSLKLTLCYDEKSNFMTVTNQDLLRSLGTKQTTMMEGGKARVRFRIEDVSKNHQGQDFCVRIAITSNSSIAPGYTPAVSIRSKRNKRQRISVSSGGSVDAASSNTSVPPQQSSLSGGLPLVHGGSGGGASSQPPSTRALYGGDPSAAYQQYQQRLLLESSSPGEQEAMLRGAVQGVSQWADDVVNNLYSFQWQILGYAQHMDGSPDYSRPYHSMPNPNQQISRMLSQYSESTRNQLRLLEEAILRGSLLGGSAANSSGATSGAAMASGTPAQESPYPSSMHPQQDPYGSMMMHPGAPPPPPPQHRAPPSHATGTMQPPPQQPLPMRMATGTAAGVPPYMMDPSGGLSYREYPPPPPPPPGDYYGRMHPSPPLPPGMMMHQHHHHASAAAGAAAGGRYDDTDPLQLPVSRATKQTHLGSSSPAAAPAEDDNNDNSDEDDHDDDNVESNVEYILAKQYKSLRTGQHLGFPAFSARKRIVGFYREQIPLGGVGGGSGGSSVRPYIFTPLSRTAIDRDEIVQQATVVLQKAMDSRSEALHALKDWGSIVSMVDHALVYDWSKDMASSRGGGVASHQGPTSTGGGGGAAGTSS